MNYEISATITGYKIPFSPFYLTFAFLYRAILVWQGTLFSPIKKFEITGIIKILIRYNFAFIFIYKIDIL